MVHETFNTVKIPIMGIGGITNWQDIVEFSLVGASAMQVGTVNFVDPQIPLNIIDDLDKYLADNGINNLSDLKGTVDLSK
jgi:dihydroorotate dehydrogenase (NAD+) catalytic subunit